MNKENQLAPSDINAEKAILGAIINFSGAFAKVPYINKDCFYDVHHQQIFEAAQSLAVKGLPIDLITIREEMKKLGWSKDDDLQYFLDLSSFVVTDANIEYHAAVLMDKKKRRDLIVFTRELMNKAYDPFADMCVTAEEASVELTRISCNEVSDGITMSEAADMMMDRIMKAQEGEVLGVPTGFPELDARGGFGLGDLIVIGADTSVGKSSFAWDIANNAAIRGHLVGYITLEMSPAQLCGRSVAQRALITSGRITNPASSGHRMLTQGELALVKDVTKDVKQLPILISEAPNDEKVYSQIKMWTQRNKIKGVFIDYLQILATKNKKFNTETEYLTHVSRRLKQLAKELNIFICVLSQFSRPQGMSKSPDLTRLRGSQEIASAADMVMLLSRPEQDGSSFPTGFEQVSTRGTALVDIKKGRNVGTGRFIVLFNSEVTKFEPVIGEPPLAVNDPPANSVHVPIDDVFKL